MVLEVVTNEVPSVSPKFLETSFSSQIMNMGNSYLDNRGPHCLVGST